METRATNHSIRWTYFQRLSQSSQRPVQISENSCQPCNRGYRSRGSYLVDTLRNINCRGFDILKRLSCSFTHVADHFLGLGLERIRIPRLNCIESLVGDIVCAVDEWGKTNLNRLRVVVGGAGDCLSSVVWRTSEHVFLKNGIYLFKRRRN
jgi:hypothetical protein